MTKQPLSPLSSIIPVKGEAARAEVMAEKPTTSTYGRAARERREVLSTRMLETHISRLRVMAYEEGRSKQSLLDQAVDEFLTRLGY